MFLPNDTQNDIYVGTNIDIVDTPEPNKDLKAPHGAYTKVDKVKNGTKSNLKSSPECSTIKEVEENNEELNSNQQAAKTRSTSLCEDTQKIDEKESGQVLTPAKKEEMSIAELDSHKEMEATESASEKPVPRKRKTMKETGNINVNSEEEDSINKEAIAVELS